MKTYIVTVEKRMVDGRPFHTDIFQIMANSPEEAHAIVHNSLELQYEPNFHITNVEEK